MVRFKEVEGNDSLCTLLGGREEAGTEQLLVLVDHMLALAEDDVDAMETSGVDYGQFSRLARIRALTAIVSKGNGKTKRSQGHALEVAAIPHL